MKRIILGAVVLSLAFPLFGDDVHPIDQKMEKCIEGDSSTAGMLNCTDNAYTAWDKELNNSYKLLMAKLDPKQKEALKTAQRAWIAWRDSEFAMIDAIYGNLQGTMYLPMRAGDRMEIVKARALTLGSYVQLLEID